MIPPRRRTAAAAALAAALVLAGCDGEAAGGPPTVRLIERLGEAEVRGGPGGGGAAATRLSRVLRPRDRDYLGRVALAAERDADGGDGEPDERLAVVVPGGAALRFALSEKGSARLRFGLGRLPDGPLAGSAGPPARAVIRVIDGGATQTVLDRALDAPGWSDLEIPLALGGATSIELAAEGPAGTWVAWSSPELVGGREPGWDLILISLDTLRADHLGCYGYARPTSPHLDALAAGAFRFARAFSPAPWTLPSHQSLFNGLYPLSHGELRSPPLAKVLWQNGYRTEARSGGGVMDYRMGTLAQGFDGYRQLDWIRDLDGLEASLAPSAGRRRFVFLHTYEPHDPYVDTRFAAALPAGRIQGYFDKGLYPHVRRDLSDDERRYIEALYDGDIAYTDEQLGELFARLEAAGALERSILVITSDHGEQFWEHGSWRHGQNLYDEQIHVPLILSLPEGLRRELGLPASGVIDDQVRLVDLYPTLLELLGIELERPVQGRSLVPLLRGDPLAEAPALAEYPNLADVDSKAVRFRGFKLLRTRSTDPARPPDASELYDLRRDPAELVNLIDRRTEVAAELFAILDSISAGAWAAEGRGLDSEELDPDLRRDLEALGYIGDG